MRLTTENCQVTARQQRAMRAGIGTMDGPDDLPVIATGDFNATVRRLLNSTTYDSGRGSGEVAAKTINTTSGPIVVVSAAVVDDMDLDDVERLLAHETGHVLLDTRQEDVGSQSYDIINWWDRWLLHIGGTAIEEVRVERAVLAAGYPPEQWIKQNNLSEALLRLNKDICVAGDPASSDADIVREQVMAVLDRTTKMLAYIAAVAIRGNSPHPFAALETDALAIWDDYIAPTWNARLELYSEIPNALDAVEDIHASNILGATLEDALLDSMGFRGSSAAFRRTGSDDLFDERVARARRQILAAHAHGARGPDSPS